MSKANKNIFFNARKELSQDAVLATLLATETNISKELLGKIIEGSLIKEGKAFLKDFSIGSVFLQDQSIDILVEIESDNKLYAVIIEDKIDTEMHDKQMSRYISNCITKKGKNGKSIYSGVYYIYFKSGTLKFWEIDCFYEEIEKLTSKFDSTIIGYFIANYQNYVKFISDNSQAFINIGEYKWISPYIEYIKKQVYSPNWMQYNPTNWTQHNSKDDLPLKFFLDKLIDKNVHYDSKNVKIGYAPGGGKRAPELWFEGICGKAVEYSEELTQNSSLEETFYFLPIMTMYDNRIEIYLQYHIYGNPNHSHGYMPKSKLESKNPTLFNRYTEICNTIKDVVKKVIEQETSWKLPTICNNGYLKIAKAECKLKQNSSKSPLSPDDFINANQDVKSAINQAIITANFLKSKFNDLQSRNNVTNLADELRNLIFTYKEQYHVS